MKLKVDFDRREAKVGEAIACRVEAERIGFAGYGMMIAEIGLPLVLRNLKCQFIFLNRASR